MTCEVCGIGTRERKLVSEAFLVAGKWVVVENIPAEVCSHCGEVTFDGSIAERVRHIVQSGQRPRGEVKADVYEYA